MRGAPPVQLTSGSDARWCGGEAALAAMTAAVAAAWMILHLGFGLVVVVAAALTAASVVAAGWWRWQRQQAAHTLAWDGETWRCDGQPGEALLMLDAGAWLLLRFVPHEAGCARWLPVGVARCGAPAHLCRVAVQAQARRARTVATLTLPSDRPSNG